MDTAIEFEIFDTTFIIQAVLPAEGIKSGSELWLYPQNWETEEVYIPNVTVNNRHSVYRDKISFTPQQYIVYLLDATLPKLFNEDRIILKAKEDPNTVDSFHDIENI